MKIVYRIPSKDPYGYVEFEAQGTVDTAGMKAAIDEMEELMAYQKGGDGLSEKDFNFFLDTYLKSGTGSSDTYAQMNAEQQKTIQCIKRSLKRIKSNPEEEIN